MFYVLRPQSHYIDPQEAYLQSRRREYLAALEQQRQRQIQQHLQEQRRREYERARAIEEYRRQALEELQRRRLAAHYAHPYMRPHNFCGEEEEEEEEHYFPRFRRAPREQQQRQIFEHIMRASPEPSPQTEKEHEVSQTPEAEEPTSIPHNTPVTTAAELQEPESDSSTDTEPSTEQIQASLATLQSLADKFDALRTSFIFPAGPLDRLTDSPTPRLAYTATNTPIHAYENTLSGLLTKIDAVESYGDKTVREKRKDLVVRIEKELENLESRVTEALTIPNTVTEVPEVVVIPAEEEKSEVAQGANEEPMEVEAENHDSEPVYGANVQSSQNEQDQSIQAETETDEPISTAIDIDDDQSSSNTSHSSNTNDEEAEVKAEIIQLSSEENLEPSSSSSPTSLPSPSPHPVLDQILPISLNTTDVLDTINSIPTSSSNDLPSDLVVNDQPIVDEENTSNLRDALLEAELPISSTLFQDQDAGSASSSSEESEVEDLVRIDVNDQGDVLVEESDGDESIDQDFEML